MSNIGLFGTPLRPPDTKMMQYGNFDKVFNLTASDMGKTIRVANANGYQIVLPDCRMLTGSRHIVITNMNTTTLSIVDNAGGIVRNIAANTSVPFRCTATSSSAGSWSVPTTFNEDIPTDPYWSNVSLLLNGDGTNGAQNNTFIDSSVNNATITRYGDTTQGSFSPFGNSWGNYFGSANFLSAPTNSAYGFGTGDFTVEAWVYPDAAYTTYNYICTVAVAGGFTFYVLGGVLTVRTFNGSDTLSSSVTPGRGKWTHVAVTRSGSTLRIYVNGGQTATMTSSLDYPQASINVGNDGNNAAPWLGYISNLRILKGTALYTSNFTPSTSPLTAITNTVLLTCQSNNFKDNSVNSATITKYGDVKVAKDSPFPEVYDKAVHGGGVYFPVTSSSNPNYLSIPWVSGGVLDNIQTNWTIEFWVNRPSSNGAWESSASNRYEQIIGTTVDGICPFYFTDGKPTFWNGTTYQFTSTPMSMDVWYHMAVVCVSNVVTLYINGVPQAATANHSTKLFSGGSVLIGKDYYNNGQTRSYISNLRILKGTALYTSNFAPPTAPLTAITNTVLLLKGENAGVYDATGKNDLTTYGNAQISTTTKKFGTGAMYFDGTRPSRLKSDATASLAFGTSDFTIEMWCYQVSKASGYPRLINFNADYTTNTHALMMNTDDAVNLFRYAVPGNIGDAIMKSTTTLSSNTWYHAAVTRSGTTFRLYVNGVLEASYTSSATVDSNATSYITLGDSPTMTASEQFNGYIDDLRITKGIARYPLNIMPTQALPLPTATAAGDDPYWASVALLLNGDGTNGSTAFTDLSSSPKAITTYGNAQISTTTKKFGTGSMYFDGTGDYLAIPNNPALSFGTGDFTVECWSYTVSATAWSNFISTGTNSDGSNLGWKVGRNGTNNILSFGLRAGGDYTNYNGTAITWNNNTWYHFAAVRSGTTLTLYWDGVMAGVFTGMSAVVNTGSGGVSVGCRYAATTADIMEFHNGYIDDLRITKGVARYTANFTPPTQSLPLSGGNSLDPYSANVSLLLNGDGANGSTTFTDLSLSPTTVTAYGNAQVSTAVKKFGTGAMYFDGTGDYLKTPITSATAMGTSDFTIECWYYPVSKTQAYPRIVCRANNSTSWATNQWGLMDRSNNTGSKFSFNAYSLSPSVEMLQGTTTVVNNIWYHLAVTKSGSTWRLFVNGVQEASLTSAAGLDGGVIGDDLSIGGTTGEGTVTCCNGYIDDLRITKGIARYAENFTPPTQSLPTKGAI